MTRVICGNGKLIRRVSLKEMPFRTGPTVRPEDEENISDKLIKDGVEEADHDQRLSSQRNRGK